MNKLSKQRKKAEITSSLEKHYLKQATSQTPHCARDNWPQNTSNKLDVDRGHESTKERKRFLRHRSGHACIPHLGDPALTTEIFNEKKS